LVGRLTKRLGPVAAGHSSGRCFVTLAMLMLAQPELARDAGDYFVVDHHQRQREKACRRRRCPR